MLTLHLRELERDGFIQREIYPDTTATGLKAADNLTLWYEMRQAGTAPSALANRRLQPTPLS
jgi:hypothetical protein